MPSTTSNLLVVVGPTAVGKTEFAIALAQRVGGEIVSADSRYLYRGMDIGTAKPSPDERRRVPHHLIDVTDPDRPWSLAEYRRQATHHIAEIRDRGRLPLLVGGTGQYIHALLRGWTIPPGQADPALRSALEAQATDHGAQALHDRLRSLDPSAAVAIDPRNVRRVIRALEVTLATGRPFSEQRRRVESPYNALVIGLTLPRPQLYHRIDNRIARMLASGLVPETQALVNKGYGWNLPAMSAIGYKQIGQYLRGEIDLSEAERQMRRETRRFVRRQANWFKINDPDILWYDAAKLDLALLTSRVRVFFELERL